MATSTAPPSDGLDPNQRLLVALGDRGCLADVRAAVGAGANVNRRCGRSGAGPTALHVAIVSNRADVSALLIGHGADLDARDDDGRTALILAAHYRRDAIAHQILDCGMDAVVGARDGMDRTPLMYAAGSGLTGVAIRLLDGGAEMDACDRNGVTALVYAGMGGHRALMRHLLERGANPEVRDSNGRTILIQTAGFVGDPSPFFRLLLGHGADSAAVDARGRGLPETLIATHNLDGLAGLDGLLAQPSLVDARKRLLARLTETQAAAWLPACLSVEAAARVRPGWQRHI